MKELTKEEKEAVLEALRYYKAKLCRQLNDNKLRGKEKFISESKVEAITKVAKGMRVDLVKKK